MNPGTSAGPAGSHLVAALWVLGASFAFALLFASGKLAGGIVPALQIVFIRYVSGLATVAGTALARRQPPAVLLQARRRWLHVLRALCGVGGGGCNIYAAMHMPLADAAALALLLGVFTVLLAVLVLREAVTRRQVAAALACLAGALLIVRGNAGGIDPAALLSAGLAPALAILGALLGAGEVILIKLLSRHDSAFSMLFHVNGLAVLLLAGPMLLWWTPVPGPVLAALCLLGPMAILGQYCNIRAYRIADAAWLAPFGYSSVAFAALIGWVAFGTVPGPVTLAGTALIVGGGLLLVRRQ